VLAALWTYLVAIEPVVQVLPSALTCPTTAEVQAKLDALMRAPQGGDDDVALVEDGGDRLRLSLRRRDGTVLGTRELEKKGTCPELASALALVIALWESDVHPEFLALGTASPAKPTPPAPSPAPTAPPPAAPVAGQAFEVGLGAGVGAGLTVGADVAWRGAADVTWLALAPQVGVRLSLAAAGERRLDLASGAARWRRTSVALGPVYRWLAGDATSAVDLHVQGLVAALDVQGDGFVTNQSERSLDLGAAAGARFWPGWWLSRWRLWLDLSFEGWQHEQVVYTAPQGDQASLPRVDVFLSLGMAYTSWPSFSRRESL